jgi:hypothetical protein
MATVAKTPRTTTVTLASASAGPFDLGFRLFDTDAITVFVDGVERLNFTLSATFADGYDDDATITFDTAVGIGSVIVIDSDLTPGRSQDYLNGPGLTEKMNVELGRVWSAIADVKRDTKRGLRTFDSVPPVALLADRVPIVNPAGDGFVMGPSAAEIAGAEAAAERAEAAAAGRVYLEAFGQNTIPGVTDMRAALVAAEAWIDAQDVEAPVILDLGGKVVGIQGTVFLSGLSGITIVNGEFLALGDASDYPSLSVYPTIPGDAQSGDDMPGPLLAVNSSINVRFDGVSVNSAQISSCIRIKESDRCGLKGVYLYNWAPHGFGIETDTKAGELDLDNVRCQQHDFNDAGRPDQAERTGFGFLIRTPDVTLRAPVANYCRYPFYKEGFGSWQMSDPHFFNGSLTTVVDGDKDFAMYIAAPGNGVIVGGYYDNGVVFINADELHSTSAKSLILVGGQFRYSGAVGENSTDLQIHTTVANNNLGGLTLTALRFDPRTDNVTMTTSGSGSFLGDRFLRWRVSNVAAMNGAPVDGLGAENTIWSQGDYAKIVTDQGDGSARTWLATRDLHLGASGTSEVTFSAPNSINIHADPEDNSGPDGFVGFSVGAFIAGKALRTGWELNGLTKIANLQITTADTSSGSLNAALIVVGSLQNRAFSTRDEIVTAIAAGDKAPDGYVVFADGIAWEYQSALAGGGAVISDMPGMKPWFNVTPNHWKRNATPGTTDMSAAAQSALNYVSSPLATDQVLGSSAGAVVDFLPQRYWMVSSVKWTGNEDHVWMRGNGAMLETDQAIAIFQCSEDAMFAGGDTAGISNSFNNKITNFTFVHRDGAGTNNYAIRAGKNTGMVITQNEFINFWCAIDGHRYIGRTISDNQFYLLTRTVQALAFIRLQGVYDSTVNYTPGGGIHIHGNEFWNTGANTGMLQQSWLIKSVDGLYYGSNHFIGQACSIRFSPDGVANNGRNNVITDAYDEGGNYFDNPETNCIHVDLTGTVGHNGAGGMQNGLYKNVATRGISYYRGAGIAQRAFRVAVTDDGGFVAARGGLQGIAISGCHISDYNDTAVNILGEPSGFIECLGLQINDNIFSQRDRRS